MLLLFATWEILHQVVQRLEMTCLACVLRRPISLPGTIRFQSTYIPGVVLNSASQREAKRGQSTNRKGEMSRASHQ